MILPATAIGYDSVEYLHWEDHGILMCRLKANFSQSVVLTWTMTHEFFTSHEETARALIRRSSKYSGAHDPSACELDILANFSVLHIVQQTHLSQRRPFRRSVRKQDFLRYFMELGGPCCIQTSGPLKDGQMKVGAAEHTIHAGASGCH